MVAGAEGGRGGASVEATPRPPPPPPEVGDFPSGRRARTEVVVAELAQAAASARRRPAREMVGNDGGSGGVSRSKG